MRKIGKQFIRNFVTGQLKMFDNFMDVTRVDVMACGKLLGFACADYEGFFYMWKEGGEYERDCRSASQKLRKFVREWVRDVTDAIYARGLKYRNFGCYGDIQQLREALDEELADFVDAPNWEHACKFHYDNLSRAVAIRHESLIHMYGKAAVSDLLCI